MAEPLKNHFKENVPSILAEHIKNLYPEFESELFVEQALAGFSELELLDRGKKLAKDLNDYLPNDFSKSASILEKSMEFPLTQTDYKPMAPFFYMPHLNYIALYGLDSPDLALPFLKEMTKKFSAEFAIRPFIEKHEDLAFTYFEKWKKDESVHVRRLVSEGTRPLLPWSFKLKKLETNPEKSLELLDFLKDDPEEYVRRSVANHLNDITKKHPEKVLTLCTAWIKNENHSLIHERKKFVKHALRTLIKQGNPSALALIGIKQNVDFQLIESNVSPKKIKKGEYITIQFTLKNNTSSKQSYLVDFIINFMKKIGSTSPKVFKWTTLELLADNSKTIQKKLLIKDFTTRKIYAGLHSVQLLINGKPVEIGAFEVI